MKRLILALLIVGFMLTGCAAVLTGGLIMKSAKSKEEKRKFLTELQQTNLEREKEGLAPLNVCIEMYRFDPGWARQSAECKTVIDSIDATTK